MKMHYFLHKIIQKFLESCTASFRPRPHPLSFRLPPIQISGSATNRPLFSDNVSVAVCVSASAVCQQHIRAKLQRTRTAARWSCAIFNTNETDVLTKQKLSNLFNVLSIVWTRGLD